MFIVASVDDRKTYCPLDIFSREKQFNSSHSMDCFCFIFINTKAEKNKLGGAFNGFELVVI